MVKKKQDAIELNIHSVEYGVNIEGVSIIIPENVVETWVVAYDPLKPNYKNSYKIMRDSDGTTLVPGKAPKTLYVDRARALMEAADWMDEQAKELADQASMYRSVAKECGDELNGIPLKMVCERGD